MDAISQNTSSIKNTGSVNTTANSQSKINNLLKFIVILGGICISFSMVAYTTEKYFLADGLPFPFISLAIVYLTSIIIIVPLKYVVFRDYSNAIPLKRTIIIGFA